MDSVELPRTRGYKYLLVGVDTYYGWPEALPCRTNQAKEAVKWLLQEVIPRFGVPIGMSSDRGPHFIAAVVKEVSRLLGIAWDLHTPCRPQSSGQVERMNQTLKRQISKICQEAKLQWPQALPIALLRIRIKPRSGMSVSPYEILYGKPYESPEPNPNIHITGKQEVYNYVLSLGKTLARLRSALVWNRLLALENPVHDILPGDEVYIKNLERRTIKREVEWTLSGAADHLYSSQGSWSGSLDTLHQSEENPSWTVDCTSCGTNEAADKTCLTVSK